MFTEKRKGKSSEIPTSSLADIAFLLLIFFLVTTTIDVDKGIGLTLPGEGETKEIRKKNIANLGINAAGEVMLDDDAIEIMQIRDIVKRRLAENPNLLVSVKTDPETNYQVYIKVLDQLKQANLTRISIAEPPK
ncbi:biopolymer transporter ExbD [candidate division KSB1 bacterium]|nr:biopolymer transporter ExbD [candidate division KSB1 bacterium]